MNADVESVNDHDALLAILIVSGADSRILSLDEILDSSWYGRPIKTGESIADGDRAEVNHGAVVICSEEDDASDAIRLVEEWLQRHSQAISSLEGTKTLEIQSCIEPGTGSKFLVIPKELVRLCSQLDCDVAHQYMRIPADDELTDHRPTQP